MKFQLQRETAYFDVDPAFRLRPGAIFRLFQEAAVLHSEQAGFASRDLVAAGTVWILNKIGVEIHRYPVHGEPLTVTTWSRGARGFKAFRDFDLRCGTEILAAATSLWLFYDTGRARLLRAPQAIIDAYTQEEAAATWLDIDRWKPAMDLAPERTVSLTVRAGDFDPLGHVNNSRYIDYLETFAQSALPDCGPPAAVTIQYLKEIGPRIDTVRVEGDGGARGGWFRVASGDSVHAAGRIDFAPQ